MNRNFLLVVLVAAIAAIAGVFAGAILLPSSTPAELTAATHLREPRPLPEFELVRHDEQPFTREDLEDQWTLVFFGFTHCPDVCPNTLYLLDRVVENLGKDREAPRVLFVSVDPARDTPAQMRDYLAYFNSDFIGVTGDDATLQRVAQAMSVAYELHPEDDGYDVIHSSAVLVIDPNARLHALFTPPLKADELSADLRTLLDSF